MIPLLVNINTLTSISLAFVKLDQASMDILSGLNQLKEFRLWFCEGLDRCNFTSVTFELDTLHLVEESVTHSILQSLGNSIKRLGLDINKIDNLGVVIKYCPNLEEIILVYLSKEKENDKSVIKVVNKLEKPWKQEISLYKEIPTKTLICHWNTN